MATENPTLTREGDGSVITYYWDGLDNADDGSPIKMPQNADVTVQVVADAGWGSGGSISFEGSLKHVAPSADGDYFTLTAPNDNVGASGVLTFTADGGGSVNEMVRWIRPHVTAGDGTTDLNVWITMRRPTDLRQ